MSGLLRVRWTGADRLAKDLDGLTGRKLQNAQRRGVRAAANVFRRFISQAAASANVPRSFQKVKAPKVTTHGGASGRSVEARVRPASPLFNIFEVGAGAHQEGGDGAFLGGPAGSGSWTQEGRKRPGDFAARGPVSHPGFAARPILPAAFAAGSSQASQALADAIFGTEAAK